jgi:predicted MFS family arabinose efflux permease
LVGVREPIERARSSASLMRDSWAGLTYVVKHATLRGLAITMFFTNLGVGPLVIGIPLIVLGRMHGGADTVGQVWAVFGVAGLVAGLLAGRLRTEGHERPLIAASIGIQVPGLIALAFATNLAEVLGVAFLVGAANAVSLVAIFAIRQRRTDPAWFGRAFAVSMSLNMVGQPIGTGLTGPLFERSIALPMLLGAAVTLAAVAATLIAIPDRGDD